MPSPSALQATEQAKRYGSLASQCSAVSPQQDLANFVRLLAQPSQAQKIPRRAFAPPQAQQPGEPAEEAADYNVSKAHTHTHTHSSTHSFTLLHLHCVLLFPQEMMPLLRNELVFDRHSTLSQRSALESLKREAIELELQIRQLQVSNSSSSNSSSTHTLTSLSPPPPLQDSIDALNRTQTRGLEGQLYNKVNELQEDLSMKKFDLRAKQIHLAAIRAQVSLCYASMW